MPVSRRSFIAGGVGAGAWLLGARARARQDGGTDGPVRPVIVLLSGGVDTLYTIDPKLPRMVDPRVALPPANEIRADAAFPLGGSWAELAPDTRLLCGLVGVQVGAANHVAALQQFVRLKTNVGLRMPGFLELACNAEQEFPLPAAYVGVHSHHLHTPGFVGSVDELSFGSSDLFEIAQRASADELQAVAKVLQKRAASMLRQGNVDAKTQTAAQNLLRASRFFNHVVNLPPPSDGWTQYQAGDYTVGQMKASLSRALWLLEHDVSQGVFVDLGALGWDSHVDNDRRQLSLNHSFAPMFHDFLNALMTRSSSHGLLGSHVMGIVGSEIGRFPMLNVNGGKDHFPQTAFLAWGPMFRRGTLYGETGRLMETQPINIRTGRVGRNATHHLTLDDVGSTLLYGLGRAPERLGYSGKILEFMLA